MKTNTFTLICGAVLLLTVQVAAAAPKTVATTVKTTSAAPARTGSDTRFGFGYSLVSELTGGASSAVTAILELSDKQALQFHLALPSSSPFEFAVVGQFKQTITESQNAGFHVGGGLGLGSVSTGSTTTIVAGVPVVTSSSGFLLSINALAGIHYKFSDAPNLRFHFDGGPTFTSTDGEADFSIGAASSWFGASVLYMF